MFNAYVPQTYDPNFNYFGGGGMPGSGPQATPPPLDQLGDIQGRLGRPEIPDFGPGYAGLGQGMGNPNFEANKGLGWQFLLPAALSAIGGGIPGFVAGGIGSGLGKLQGNALDAGQNWVAEHYPRLGNVTQYIPQAWGAYNSLKGLGSGNTSQQANSLLNLSGQAMSLLGNNRSGTPQTNWPGSTNVNQFGVPQQVMEGSMEEFKRLIAEREQANAIRDRNQKLMDDSTWADSMRRKMYEGSGGWGTSRSGYGFARGFDPGSTIGRMGFSF